jgi:selenide,water dikinase
MIKKLNKVRLTQTVSCAGCAGKLPPEFLHKAVSGIEWHTNKNVLHAMQQSEDCGVYQINEKEALIHTTDFFSPVVDDPYMFGQIAAANSLSDIYAMGGKPLSALNILCYDPAMGEDVLKEILRGASDKAKEADCPIIGGHSVKNDEIKFGLAVTGIAPIDSVLYNSKSNSGDVLILCKPLGTGILNTAVKRDDISSETMDLLINTMAQLNKTAGELAVKHGANAVTDVTGFSLMGHGMEMARSAELDFVIEFDKLPILPDVFEAIKKGFITGGSKNNRVYTDGFYKLGDSIDSDKQNLLFDPQTSGGLLIAIAENKAEAILNELKKSYPHAAIIGYTQKSSSQPGVINVI